MSWRDGSRLFLECWPHIRAHVQEDSVRRDFVARLVELFAEFDMDPHDLIGVDPELDSVLGTESEDDDPSVGISCCIRDLATSDDPARQTAATAILAFVGSAGGARAQEAADALLEACVRDGPDCVRVTALMSLRELIDEYAAVIGHDAIVPLTVSGSDQVREQAEYVLRAILRNA